MPTGSTPDPHHLNDRAEQQAYARGYLDGLRVGSASERDFAPAAQDADQRAAAQLPPAPSVPRLIVPTPDRVPFDPDAAYWADVPLLRVVDAGDGLGRLEPVRGHVDLATLNGAGYSPTSRNLVPGDVYGWLTNPDFGQYAELVSAGERPLDLRFGFEVDLWRTLLARGERIGARVYRRRLRHHDRHIRQVIEAGYELVATGYSSVYFGKPADVTWTRW